jgi:hypothetical protein
MLTVAAGWQFRGWGTFNATLRLAVCPLCYCSWVADIQEPTRQSHLVHLPCRRLREAAEREEELRAAQAEVNEARAQLAARAAEVGGWCYGVAPCIRIRCKVSA